MTIPVDVVLRGSSPPPGWTAAHQEAGTGIEGLFFSAAVNGGKGFPLLPASRVPALHSCARDLADSVRATEILGVADAYVAGTGLADAAWLASPLTWFMLTDDPTRKGRGLLFMVHENSGATEAQIDAGAPVVPNRSTLVVAFDEGSGTPLGVGQVDLP